MLWRACRSQRTTCGRWFSHSTTQVLGIELGFSDLVTGTFTLWAITDPVHFRL